MSEFRRKLMMAQKKEQYIKMTLLPTAEAYLQFPDNPDLIAVANKPVRFTWDITSSNKWNRYDWYIFDNDTNNKLTITLNNGENVIYFSSFATGDTRGTGEGYLTLSKDTHIGLGNI